MVTWHRGREAAALAAAFGVLQLPAVVYLPPNCIAGTSSVCTCALHLGHRGWALVAGASTVCTWAMHLGHRSWAPVAGASTF